MRTCVRAIVAAFLLAVSSPAIAAPFVVTSQLTGDPRLSNPDNIVVKVTIAGDTTSNVVQWTIAPASTFHPNIVLDAFGFNVLLPGGVTAAFGDFTPGAWSAPAVSATLAGSGATQFQFVFQDPPKPDNNVTNLTPLTFSMSLSAGTFNPGIFLFAPVSVSNDGTLGASQLGAHLRALNANEDESDSGVAFGNFTYNEPRCEIDCDPGDPGDPVPEPAMLALIGMGLVGASLASRRR